MNDLRRQPLPYPARPYALSLRDAVQLPPDVTVGEVLRVLKDPLNSRSLPGYAVVVDLEERGLLEVRAVRWDHERRLCVLEIA